MREGEHVFGVAHIFASFNDTFIVSNQLSLFMVMCTIVSYFQSLTCALFDMQHVTDLSGRETLVRITGKVYSLAVSIDVLVVVCLFHMACFRN